MDKKTNKVAQRKEIENKKKIDKFINSTIESTVEQGLKKAGLKFKKEK